MYRKSLAASHGKVNFQWEGKRENLGSSKSTSTVSTVSKSGLSSEAIFQERFPSYV